MTAALRVRTASIYESSMRRNDFAVLSTVLVVVLVFTDAAVTNANSNQSHAKAAVVLGLRAEAPEDSSYGYELVFSSF
ncbi:unnamed protein product [Toxocara canis]|uniref:Secreted protein n=1 Tax=Toxocara canis TaxID=6265 RepID=A0A183U2M3_TOXCA|nr:unnamed protein product [Toxocara canis]